AGQGGGAPRRGSDERHLAEHGARAERLQLLLAAAHRHGPLADDEHLVGRVAFLEDHASGRKVARVGDEGEHLAVAADLRHAGAPPCVLWRKKRSGPLELGGVGEVLRAAGRAPVRDQLSGAERGGAEPLQRDASDGGVPPLVVGEVSSGHGPRFERERPHQRQPLFSRGGGSQVVAGLTAQREATDRPRAAGPRPLARGGRAGFGGLGVLPRRQAPYPTLPSRLTPSSFWASTANSIGSSLNTSLQKPFTIMLTASSVPIPRCWK